MVSRLFNSHHHMKFKTLLLIAGLTASTLSANAQTTSLDGQLEEFIPKEWTIDRRAKLIAGDNPWALDESKDNINLSIYNHEFEKEASINIKAEKYTRRKREERAEKTVLSSMAKIDTMSFDVAYYYYYGHLIDSVIANNYIIPDSSLYIANNGDSIFVTKFDRDYRTEELIPSEGMKIDFKKRLLTFFIFYYEYKYLGEWSTEYYENTIMPTAIRYVDLDEATMVHDTEESYFTQTLFNDDEKYEYLMPDYSSMTEEVEEDDRDGDGIIDYRYTYYYPKALRIINSDGEKVGSLDFSHEQSDTDYMELLHWGGKFYFHGESETYIDDEFVYTQHFYLFDRNTTSVKKVDTPAMFSIMPQVTKKHNPVEIEIADEASKNGGEIIVTDMNGREVYSRQVKQGERTLLMPVNRLSSGVYGVSYTTNGKRIETSKLIVR